MKPIEQFLRKSNFFISLSDNELSKIAPHFTVSNYKKGEIILHEDQVADRFFIISEGVVEVWKNYDRENPVRLAVQTAGNIFGEMALIDDEPRSATVIAMEACSVLQMHKTDFYTLSEEHPAIMFAVLRALSKVIRQSNDSFISSLSKQNEELHNALKDLKATQEELIRTERFSNLGKLSSLLVHDLRNPLSVIKGYGEMLQVLQDEPDQVQEYSLKIVQEVVRMNQFAQELLDYSRGDLRLVWVYTSFPMIFQKIKQYLGHSLENNNIDLILECRCNTPFYMDEERFLRAIFNLCDNARKAMHNGGTITIEAECNDGTLQVVVNDTGHGMDAHVLEHIFEPFYSSSHQGGTGLGMVSVKTIIEAHGGSVEIQSELDKGTSVTLLMPQNAELPE